MQPADGTSTEGVGSLLATAREERGLTVEDVSEATRIRATLIRYIEQDDFSACGGSVYARGHIRSISRVLGLDPMPFIDAFNRDHSHDTQNIKIAPAPEFDPLPQRDHPRGHRGLGWAPLMIGSLTLVCIVALVMLVLPDSSGDGDAARAPTSTAPVQVAPPSAAPPSPTPSALPTSMNVRVEARGDASWLEVRDDREQVLVRQLLERGQERTVVTERPVSIKMGNAGAIGLSCNGRDVGVPGDRGAVVTVRLALAASGACTTAPGGAGPVAAAPAPAPFG